MVKLKATGVIDCRTYITEKYGAEAHEKIKAAMSEEDRDVVYSEELLPVTWIGLDPVMNHLVTFDKVIGRGDGKAAEAMIRSLAYKHYNLHSALSG